MADYYSNMEITYNDSVVEAEVGFDYDPEDDSYYAVSVDVKRINGEDTSGNDASDRSYDLMYSIEEGDDHDKFLQLATDLNEVDFNRELQNDVDLQNQFDQDR